MGLTNDGPRFCKEHQIFCTAISDCNPDAPEETSVVPPERALRDHDDAAILRIKSSLSTGVDLPTGQPITVGGSPLKVLRISETCLQHANHALLDLASLGFPAGGWLWKVETWNSLVY